MLAGLQCPLLQAILIQSLNICKVCYVLRLFIVAFLIPKPAKVQKKKIILIHSIDKATQGIFLDLTRILFHSSTPLFQLKTATTKFGFIPVTC